MVKSAIHMKCQLALRIRRSNTCAVVSGAESHPSQKGSCRKLTAFGRTDPVRMKTVPCIKPNVFWRALTYESPPHGRCLLRISVNLLCQNNPLNHIRTSDLAAGYLQGFLVTTDSMRQLSACSCVHSNSSVACIEGARLEQSKYSWRRGRSTTTSLSIRLYTVMCGKMRRD